MASNDTIKKTLTVALLLCVVCSVIVSAAAVFLKPIQLENKTLDKKKNILAAAGLLEPGKSVEELFTQIESKVVDLKTGEFTDAVDPYQYDQRKASKDPKQSVALASADDIASIKRLEQYATVYLVKEGDAIKTVILPVRGYGLWSTLWGFLALEGDFNTVVGLGFYEHAETPGLGGEVDNPKWKSIWVGKNILDAEGEVAIEVIKGSVTQDTAGSINKVDGLSGATLTSRGVSNLVQFWLGEHGFGPFLAQLRAKGA